MFLITVLAIVSVGITAGSVLASQTISQDLIIEAGMGEDGDLLINNGSLGIGAIPGTNQVIFASGKDGIPASFRVDGVNSGAVFSLRATGGQAAFQWIDDDLSPPTKFQARIAQPDTKRFELIDATTLPGKVRLAITEAGNVGIGTTNPTSKLHVVGDTTIESTLTVGTASINSTTGNIIAENYFDNGNTQTGTDASALGGSGNNASASHSTVGGGLNNNASGTFSTAGGGLGNTASGGASTVGGGQGNVADGSWSTMGGGVLNLSNGSASTVGGGDHNIASGDDSTVGGGERNTASGNRSTVAGGRSNTAIGDHSAVGGGGGSFGFGNTAGGDLSTVGGGGNNEASGPSSTVGGGGGVVVGNTASGEASTIGGGRSNNAIGDDSTVGGGLGNSASGDQSTVGGGENNIATSSTSLSWSTVAGGFSNTAGGQTSTVGGGIGNMASGSNSVVGGGSENIAGPSGSSTVGGGVKNIAAGFTATVPGGRLNEAIGNLSFAAGNQAKANHDGAFVWADSALSDFLSTAENQFSVRANGGAFFDLGSKEFEVDGKIIGVPIVGQWAPNSDTTDAGLEFVDFDVEKENTGGSTYFDFTAGNDYIEIIQPGTYRIGAFVHIQGGSVGETLHWTLSRWSSIDVFEEVICNYISRAGGVEDQGSCSSIDTVTANDRIRLRDLAGSNHIFGDGLTDRTFINIEKLN